MLAEASGVERGAFAQLTDTERLDARPVAFTFERVPEQPTPPVELGLTGSLLAELVLNVQIHGPIQWRLAPREHVVPAGMNGNGASRNGHVARNGGAKATATTTATATTDTKHNDRRPRRSRSTASRRATPARRGSTAPSRGRSRCCRA